MSEALRRSGQGRGVSGLLPVAAAVALIAATVVVAALRLDPSRSADNRHPLACFWLAGALLWLSLSLIALRLRRRPTLDAAATTAAVRWIVLLALFARLLVVAFGRPALSDDLWRYLHDGRTLGVEGRNPYTLSPAEAAHRDPRHALPVNHPHLVTIYQPTSQWVFAALARLASAAGRWGQLVVAFDEEAVFRFAFALLDMAVIALLLVKLRREGRSPWWAALYAWHPLAIAEFAGSGHQDVLGIALLLAALLCADRLLPLALRPRKERVPPPERSAAGEGAPGRVGGSVSSSVALGVLFALAIGVKPIVAPLALPIAWRMRGRPWRHAVLAGVAGILTLAALYVPFALMEGGIGRMLETVRIFTDTWAYNGSLHPLLVGAGLPPRVVSALAGAALLAILVAATAMGLDLWRIALIYFFGALLLSSTAHPWYLLWALALLPVRFSWSVRVWSLTMAWSYAAFINPREFQPPAWVVVAEYLPVYAVLAWEARAAWRRRARNAAPSAPPPPSP